VVGLPTSTVTFRFADIDGSTQLHDQFGTQHGNFPPGGDHDNAVAPP
jgi:hypothetical protein